MIYTKSLIIIDTQNFLFYNNCVMGYNHNIIYQEDIHYGKTG